MDEMNSEKVLRMDQYILLSWTNTQLRDHFKNLDLLCDDFDFTLEDLTTRLDNAGYSYDIKHNQFALKDI